MIIRIVSADFQFASLHQRLIKCHRCAIIWCFAYRVRRLHLRLIECHRCAIILPILQSRSDDPLLTADAAKRIGGRHSNAANL